MISGGTIFLIGLIIGLVVGAGGLAFLTVKFKKVVFRLLKEEK